MPRKGRTASDPRNFTGDIYTTRSYRALERWPVGTRPGDTGTYARFQSEARPTIESISRRRPDPNRPAGRPDRDKFLVTVTDPEGKAWLDYRTTDTMRANDREFAQRMDANRAEIAAQREARSVLRSERRDMRTMRRDAMNAQMRRAEPNRNYDANLADLPLSKLDDGNFRPQTITLSILGFRKGVDLGDVFAEGDFEVFGRVEAVATCEWSGGSVRETMSPAGGSTAIFNASRDDAVDISWGAADDWKSSRTDVKYAVRDCYDKPDARIRLDVRNNLSEKDLATFTDDHMGFYSYGAYLEQFPTDSSNVTTGDTEIRSVLYSASDPGWRLWYEPQDGSNDKITPRVKVNID